MKMTSSEYILFSSLSAAIGAFALSKGLSQGYLLLGVSVLSAFVLFTIKLNGRNTVTIYDEDTAGYSAKKLGAGVLIATPKDGTMAKLGYETVQDYGNISFKGYFFESMFPIHPIGYSANEAFSLGRFICYPASMPKSLISRYAYERSVEAGSLKEVLPNPNRAPILCCGIAGLYGISRKSRNGKLNCIMGTSDTDALLVPNGFLQRQLELDSLKFSRKGASLLFMLEAGMLNVEYLAP